MSPDVAQAHIDDAQRSCAYFAERMFAAEDRGDTVQAMVRRAHLREAVDRYRAAKHALAESRS